MLSLIIFLFLSYTEFTLIIKWAKVQLQRLAVAALPDRKIAKVETWEYENVRNYYLYTTFVV